MIFHFSFIIPVYNRPQEIEELLQSMTKLEYDSPFEIVIIEDGSTATAAKVVEEYQEKLGLSYYVKENSGPGDSRNYGMQRAKGDYFIILDSDVILPHYYLYSVAAFLEHTYVDCFGGPDGAHEDFNSLQVAISYSMTSLLTTGGIRGASGAVHQFQPRSFNMGLSKAAFQASGGFGNIHPGEDPDLVIRLWKLGYETALVPDADVYHKRRISWNKFYQQVHKFGLVRPILNSWHPKTSKITFWFPSLFLLYVAFAILLSIFGQVIFMLPFMTYFIILFLDASIRHQSIVIGWKSCIAAWVQFYGYGTGFLKSYYYIHILKKKPEEHFKHLFF